MEPKWCENGSGAQEAQRPTVQHLKEQFKQIMEKLLLPKKCAAEGAEEEFGKELNQTDTTDSSSKISVLAIVSLNRDVSLDYYFFLLCFK